jgi:hypothetical protein
MERAQQSNETFASPASVELSPLNFLSFPHSFAFSVFAMKFNYENIFSAERENPELLSLVDEEKFVMQSLDKLRCRSI